jgi:methylthioribose-1-phosphate isomerase
MQVDRSLSLIYGVPTPRFYAEFREASVFVAEQRPGLDGMRVVGRELLRRRVTPVILCDNMMAFVMERGLVKDVCIFADTLDATKAECRTGSLIAALVAREHKVPVYLYNRAGRVTTGSLLKIGGRRVTTPDLKTYVPLTEEVPLELTTEIRNG